MKSIQRCIFFAILFSSSVLYAQENFINAYYVTFGNDTVRGLVAYRAEHLLNKSIIFKQDHGSSAIRLLPSEVKSVAFADRDYYESITTTGWDGQAINVFFRVLLKGKLSLYTYDSRYYTFDEKNVLVDITRRTVTTGGTSRVDYSGMGLLSVLMKDCSGMVNTPEQEYQKSNPNYLSLFQQYHNCLGQGFRQSARIVLEPRFDFGVQFVATMTTFSVRAVEGKATSDPGPSIRGGVFMSLFVPRFSENLRFVAEATFTIEDRYVFFSTTKTNNDLYVKTSMVHVPIILRYNAGSFFIDAGFENQLILSETTRWREELRNDNEVITKKMNFEPMGFMNWGVVGGAGVRFKMFQYPVRFSMRYSRNELKAHPLRPGYMFIQSVLAVQLTK